MPDPNIDDEIRSKVTSFDDESDNRFPRARVLVVGGDTSLAAAFLGTECAKRRTATNCST